MVAPPPTGQAEIGTLALWLRAEIVRIIGARDLPWPELSERIHALACCCHGMFGDRPMPYSLIILLAARCLRNCGRDSEAEELAAALDESPNLPWRDSLPALDLARIWFWTARGVLSAGAGLPAASARNWTLDGRTLSGADGELDGLFFVAPCLRVLQAVVPAWDAVGGRGSLTLAGLARGPAGTDPDCIRGRLEEALGKAARKRRWPYRPAVLYGDLRPRSRKRQTAALNGRRPGS